VYSPAAYAGRLSRLAVMLNRSKRRRELPEGDVRKKPDGIEALYGILRALPEVREPFWSVFVKVAKTNPNAARYIVMLMALYTHLGPFSKHVIGEIDRRIAELDEANRGTAGEMRSPAHVLGHAPETLIRGLA